MCWSAEDRAIDYLPHVAQLLYLRVLRRHVDINTGVVGLSMSLSYQVMGDVLAVRSEPDIGKPEIRLTTIRIRSALTTLEHAGLIKPLTIAGKNRALVFLLPYLNRKRKLSDNKKAGD